MQRRLSNQKKQNVRQKKQFLSINGTPCKKNSQTSNVKDIIRSYIIKDQSQIKTQHSPDKDHENQVHSLHRCIKRMSYNTKKDKFPLRTTLFDPKFANYRSDNLQKQSFTNIKVKQSIRKKRIYTKKSSLDKNNNINQPCSFRFPKQQRRTVSQGSNRKRLANRTFSHSNTNDTETISPRKYSTHNQQQIWNLKDRKKDSFLILGKQQESFDNKQTFDIYKNWYEKLEKDNCQHKNQNDQIKFKLIKDKNLLTSGIRRIQMQYRNQRFQVKSNIHKITDRQYYYNFQEFAQPNIQKNQTIDNILQQKDKENTQISEIDEIDDSNYLKTLSHMNQISQL